MADIKLKINLDIKDHTYYCLDDIVTINDFGFIEIIFHQKLLENIYCHEYRIIYGIKPFYIIFYKRNRYIKIMMEVLICRSKCLLQWSTQ